MNRLPVLFLSLLIAGCSPASAPPVAPQPKGNSEVAPQPSGDSTPDPKLPIEGRVNTHGSPNYRISTTVDDWIFIGDMLLATTISDTFTRMSVADGLSTKVKAPCPHPSHVAASPKGDRIAVGCYDRVRILSWPELAVRRDLPIGDGTSNNMRMLFSTDGQTIAVVDQSILTWFDTQSGRKLGQVDRVQDVANHGSSWIVSRTNGKGIDGLPQTLTRFLSNAKSQWTLTHEHRQFGLSVDGATILIQTRKLDHLTVDARSGKLNPTAVPDLGNGRILATTAGWLTKAGTETRVSRDGKRIGVLNGKRFEIQDANGALMKASDSLDDATPLAATIDLKKVFFVAERGVLSLDRSSGAVTTIRPGRATHVSLSPDDQTLAVVGDHGAALMDLSTGKSTVYTGFGDHRPDWVTFTSASQGWFLSRRQYGGSRAHAMRFELGSAKVRKPINLPFIDAEEFKVDPSGQLLLMMGAERLTIAHLSTGLPLRTTNLEYGDSDYVSINPEGQVIVVAEKRVLLPDGQIWKINAQLLSPTGEFVVAQESKTRFGLYGVSDRRAKVRWQLPTAVDSFKFIRANLLVARLDDGRLSFLDIPALPKVAPLSVRALDLAPSHLNLPKLPDSPPPAPLDRSNSDLFVVGNLLVANTLTGPQLKDFAKQTATPLLPPKVSRSSADAIATDGKTRIAIARDSRLFVLTADGTILLELGTHTGYSGTVAIAKDRVLHFPARNHLELTNLDGTSRWRVPATSRATFGLAPNAQWAVVSSAGGAKVLSGKAGTEIVSLTMAPAVCTLTISSDGRWLATSGHDGRLLLWQTSNWTVKHRIDGFARCAPMAFSSNGGQLAISDSQRVTTWQTATGEQRTSFAVGARNLAWAPEGLYAVNGRQTTLFKGRYFASKSSLPVRTKR